MRWRGRTSPGEERSRNLFLFGVTQRFIMRADIKNRAKNRRSEFAGQAANIPQQVVNEDDQFNDNDESDDET